MDNDVMGSNTDFADQIAELCYTKYAKLPKTGKPNSMEWTLLAGIVQAKAWSPSCGQVDKLQVVALGTGSKCIGQSQLSFAGDIINDSHAEVIARRSFLRYLYSQACSLYKMSYSDIFHLDSSGKCSLKKEVSFHFFMSHTPCGDGSIFPKADIYSEGCGQCLNESTDESNKLYNLFLNSRKKTCENDKYGVLNFNEDKVDCLNFLNETYRKENDDRNLKRCLKRKICDSKCDTDCNVKNTKLDINNEQSIYVKPNTACPTGEEHIEKASKNHTYFGSGEDTVAFKSSNKAEENELIGNEVFDSLSEIVGSDAENKSAKTSKQIEKIINIPEPNHNICKEVTNSLLEVIYSISESHSTKSSELIKEIHCFQKVSEENQDIAKSLTEVKDCISKSKEGSTMIEIEKEHSCEIKCLTDALGTTSTEDIHRTGAKCLLSETLQDSHLSGSSYHTVGALRTKPGRGDPTLSLSCSDKLARWNAVGIQGSLLSLLLTAPITMASLTVGGGCPFSHTALLRAVAVRAGTLAPLLMQASLPFPDARSKENVKRPCPTSIMWSQVENRPLEVSVAGRRQGVSKTVSRSHLGRLQICKKELLCQFIDTVFLAQKKGLVLAVPQDSLKTIPYREWKALARKYRQNWEELRCTKFPAWRSKPDNLLEFTAED